MKTRESMLRKKLKTKYTNEELDFILRYEYKGKNAAQWYHLASISTHRGEDGFPKWMEFIKNYEDTLALSAIRIKNKLYIENFGNEN